MSQSRRSALVDIQPIKGTNTSLWLDKYLDRNENEPNQTLVDQIVAHCQDAPGYDQFLGQWKSALEKAGVKQFKRAHTLTRLAVNLGADSVLETNLALHRTYGVPYIPGSALKGLASHFANQSLKDESWKKGGIAHQVVFGDENTAGYVTFFDALHIPKSGKDGKALWKDVITVHHAAYYQSGDQPPADYDSTVVIPFITASGSFLIALAGPDDWVEKAYQILELALREEGIGAKTNSGYGRMSFDEDLTPPPSKPKVHYQIEKRRLLEEASPEGRNRGIVESVKQNGKFAFVNPKGGGRQHFIHSSQIIGSGDLEVGQVVEYRLVQTDRGPQGRDVLILLTKQDF